MQKIAQFTLPQVPGREPVQLVIESPGLRHPPQEFTIGIVDPASFGAVDYILLAVEDIPYLRRALEAVEEALDPPPPDETFSAARGAIRMQGITGVEYGGDEHSRSPHGHCTQCGTLWPCRVAVARVAEALRTKGEGS